MFYCCSTFSALTYTGTVKYNFWTESDSLLGASKSAHNKNLRNLYWKKDIKQSLRTSEEMWYLFGFLLLMKSWWDFFSTIHLPGWKWCVPNSRVLLPLSNKHGMRFTKGVTIFKSLNLQSSSCITKEHHFISFKLAAKEKYHSLAHSGLVIEMF